MLKLEKNIALTLAAVVKKKFTGKNDRLFYLKYHTYLALGDNSVFFKVTIIHNIILFVS